MCLVEKEGSEKVNVDSVEAGQKAAGRRDVLALAFASSASVWALNLGRLFFRVLGSSKRTLHSAVLQATLQYLIRTRLSPRHEVEEDRSFGHLQRTGHPSRRNNNSVEVVLQAEAASVAVLQMVRPFGCNSALPVPMAAGGVRMGA